MSRAVFLTVVAGVAVCIGGFAAALPHRLLDSKGVTPTAAANVWGREVGVLIAAVGVTAFLVRDQPDSPTLRALLIGNVIVQLRLLRQVPTPARLRLTALANRLADVATPSGPTPNQLGNGTAFIPLTALRASLREGPS
ncbi:hypothetical protein AB0K00_25405 [Dactylosporangium sp. NPDC049525]|uniref:hypothetical protein n=1 Tax=Dactylosporangium sp. NPDC049525 TaxID=3154730 RepID=UPI00343B41A6